MPQPLSSAAAAVAAAAFLSASLPAGAFSISESSGHASSAANYYRRHAEGWYWYQDPEPEKEIRVEDKPALEPLAKPEQAQEQAEREQAERDDQPLPPAADSPKPLSAQWVRDMLPKYRDLMWSEPTPENVKAYFLLQRFAIDRSQKVAEVAQQVTLGNPLLDETFRRPTASFGVNAVDRNAGIHADEMLRKIAKKAGLFFFFKSDCRYCEAQAPLIGMLEKENDFDVLAVSIDGGTLESFRFANTRMNAGHAEQLGVTATPAVFLVSGDGRFESLGQGLMALPELRRRILVAAARQGWIDEADYQSTKPIINPDSQIDLSKELPKLLLAAQNPALAWGSSEGSDAAASLSEEAAEALAGKDGFISPSSLVALFDGAGTDGQFNPRLLSTKNKNEEVQD